MAQGARRPVCHAGRSFLRQAVIAALVLLLGEFGAIFSSNARDLPPIATRELVIGIKEAPPFAIKRPGGEWEGISVDLWREVANNLHFRYRFAEEPTVGALIDAAATGKYDVSIGAITVTAARVRALDFTSPFYSTGLGIAVPASGSLSWMPVLQAFMNVGFLQAVLALLFLALAVGVIIWFFERKSDEFGGSVKKGLSSGMWWATAAMTRRGMVEYSPRTVAGRIVASIWTVTSIVAIAVFTAAITSALTVRHLQGAVHGVQDLRTVRVGMVKGTSTHDALSELQITAHEYATARDGLLALRAHKIDAFVYDKPLLTWVVQQQFPSSVEMLDAMFQPQHYAFAIPNDSPLRGALNIAILDAIQSTWWKQTTTRYLGSTSH
jgi:ABC-type amino acid transport substrate-binding protein